MRYSIPHTLTHAEFSNAEVDMDKPLVGTCGSAVTACILAFTAHAHMLGKDMSVYNVSFYILLH